MSLKNGKNTTLWHSRQGKDVLQNLLARASIKEGFMEVVFMMTLERQASIEQDCPRAGNEYIKDRDNVMSLLTGCMRISVAHISSWCCDN